VSVGRLRTARPRGRHYLRSRSLAEQLVADAGIHPGELVLDLGAGRGILTRALRDAGARVTAVELDMHVLDDLRRLGVRVVREDIRTVPLPHEPFRVVANLPFASATRTLRHLLDDPRTPLVSCDVIVEWGLAEKRTAVWPSTLTSVYWGAWYELGLVRRVPRACFAPPPSVDAAVLRARRRATPLVPVREASAYRAFLQRAFGDKPVPRARRLANALGFDPHARGRDLDARQWAAVYRSQSVRVIDRGRS
jgi:23S rRNA (adenine-N6)-dimethyltransferase